MIDVSDLLFSTFHQLFVSENQVQATGEPWCGAWNARVLVRCSFLSRVHQGWPRWQELRECVFGEVRGTQYWFSARDLTLSLSHMARNPCK